MDNTKTFESCRFDPKDTMTSPNAIAMLGGYISGRFKKRPVFVSDDPQWIGKSWMGVDIVSGDSLKDDSTK